MMIPVHRPSRSVPTWLCGTLGVVLGVAIWPIKLLMAQLSRDELVLIALNLLDGEGRNMRQLVADYGLLKHLQPGRLRQFVERELPMGSFGRKSAGLTAIAN
jgi:Putative phage abortive infection protein